MQCFFEETQKHMVYHTLYKIVNGLVWVSVAYHINEYMKLGNYYIYNIFNLFVGILPFYIKRKFDLGSLKWFVLLLVQVVHFWPQVQLTIMSEFITWKV